MSAEVDSRRSLPDDPETTVMIVGWEWRTGYPATRPIQGGFGPSVGSAIFAPAGQRRRADVSLIYEEYAEEGSVAGHPL